MTTFHPSLTPIPLAFSNTGYISRYICWVYNTLHDKVPSYLADCSMEDKIVNYVFDLTLKLKLFTRLSFVAGVKALVIIVLLPVDLVMEWAPSFKNIQMLAFKDFFVSPAVCSLCTGLCTLFLHIVSQLSINLLSTSRPYLNFNSIL